MLCFMYNINTSQKHYLNFVTNTLKELIHVIPSIFKHVCVQKIYLLKAVIYNTLIGPIDIFYNTMKQSYTCMQHNNIC